MVRREKAQVRLKTNVRDLPSSFVGRTTELATLRRLFDGDARLVSIVAPGGMGKTRVAMRYAIEHAKRYSMHGGGGAWLCDLTEARSGMAIAAVVAQVLGVPLPSGTSEADVLPRLGDAIAEHKRILLVLDNLEHVAEHAERTVGQWLRSAPHAHFLVTSRVSLGVAGEQLLPLEPLEPPEAHDLFVRRVGQVRPDAKLTKEDQPRIDDILHRLGRMPLAIELAAARVSVLSIEQIHERLDASLDLLVGRGTGRHASMRRAIVDSHRLLSDEERAFFAGIAVFRAGFTLSSAQAVLGTPTSSVLALIEALCAHSLLRVLPGADRRFAMYETIFAFALEKLEALPNARDIRDAHAAYFARWGRERAQAMVLEDSPRMLAPLDAELENIVVAHTHAVAAARGTNAVEHKTTNAVRALQLALALEPVVKARGLFRLRLRLLHEALLVARDTTAGELGEAAYAIVARGEAQRELGDFSGARRDFEEGIAHGKRLGDRALEAITRMHLGDLFERQGELNTGRDQYTAALGLVQSVPDVIARAYEAHIRRHRGHVLRRAGELAEARIEIEHATELFRLLGNEKGMARAIYESGVIALFLRRYDDAGARFEAGLALASKVDARAEIGANESALGTLLQEQGDPEAAVAHHAAAVVCYREVGNRYREGGTLYYLAGAYLERGDRVEAEQLVAAALVRVAGEARYEALVHGLAAVLHAQKQNLPAAQLALDRADARAESCAQERTLYATIAIHRLNVLAAADPATRTERLAEARKWAARYACDDPRFALRVFESGMTTERRASFVIDAQGFRAPGKATVSLARRAPLRRLLHALARKRVASPGDAVGLDEIIEAAWPGERIVFDAATNRVRVAIAALRKLGLRDAILSAERGYLLDPAVAIVLAPSVPRDAAEI